MVWGKPKSIALTDSNPNQRKMSTFKVRRNVPAHDQSSVSTCSTPSLGQGPAPGSHSRRCGVEHQRFSSPKGCCSFDTKDLMDFAKTSCFSHMNIMSSGSRIICCSSSMKFPLYTSSSLASIEPCSCFNRATRFGVSTFQTPSASISSLPLLAPSPSLSGTPCQTHAAGRSFGTHHPTGRQGLEETDVPGGRFAREDVLCGSGRSGSWGTGRTGPLVM